MVENQCHPYIPSTTVLGDSFLCLYMERNDAKLRPRHYIRLLYHVILTCFETAYIPLAHEKVSIRIFSRPPPIPQLRTSHAHSRDYVCPHRRLAFARFLVSCVFITFNRLVTE